ncbi:hypothetical protein LTR66_015795, partial [Elasticomyces elasticus]
MDSTFEMTMENDLRAFTCKGSRSAHWYHNTRLTARHLLRWSPIPRPLEETIELGLALPLAVRDTVVVEQKTTPPYSGIENLSFALSTSVYVLLTPAGMLLHFHLHPTSRHIDTAGWAIVAFMMLLGAAARLGGMRAAHTQT